MKIIDLSQPLFDGAPNCPAHPPIAIGLQTHSGDAPDSWQMEFFRFASHSGSHLDAPLHKIFGGAGVEDFPLEHWCGDAIIADVRGIAAKGEIGVSHLENLDVRGKIVLLATGWGEKRAPTEEWLHQSPFLGPQGARWLVEHGARAVGIDHFSIGGMGEANAQTHEILLRAGVWIVEELSFPAAIFEVETPFTFQALPLNFRGTNGQKFSGAPCRPVALLP